MLDACSGAMRLVARAIVIVAVPEIAAASWCPAQAGDPAANKALANITRMAAACPSGQRTEKQQAECKRVVDSIQTARARQLKTMQVDAAIAISGEMLLDSSFVADDDGAPLAPGRWVRVGSIAGDAPPRRAGLELNLGRASGRTVLVGALVTGGTAAVSVAVQLDCGRKQALVIKVLAGDAIDEASEKGIGPWYPIGRRPTVLQAMARRACG
jgi:hypothetical protein